MSSEAPPLSRNAGRTCARPVSDLGIGGPVCARPDHRSQRVLREFVDFETEDTSTSLTLHTEHIFVCTTV